MIPKQKARPWARFFDLRHAISAAQALGQLRVMLVPYQQTATVTTVATSNTSGPYMMASMTDTMLVRPTRKCGSA